MQRSNLFFLLSIGLLASTKLFSQAYQIDLDSTNTDSTTFIAHLTVDDEPDDSLLYAIDLYTFDNQDSTLAYRDTFNYHNPRVVAFKSINFKYQTDKTWLSLDEFTVAPFLVRVYVLNKTNNLLNTVNLSQYK